jgi:hypothetical protein
MSEKENVDNRVEQFIAVRDKLKEMDEAHEAKRKPLLAIKEELSGWLLDLLDKMGAENIKTAHGTVHTTTRSSASLADPQAFMDFVIESERYELLDRRANSTAVKDYIQDHQGNLPPGVNFSSVKTVGVRRA